MKHVLMTSTALAACAFAAAPVMAQDLADEAAAEGPIDRNTIVVTATRRAEDVQDIPLAVTAVTAAALERQGVDDVTEITQVSPSFSTSNAQLASGSVVLRIRGIGTTSNNIGFESAVGIFVDGAYQSRPGIALSEFVDVERVEVLRGPQGTLFGRNTSAGALNITNVRPDLSEFGGFGNATYGNRDLYSVQGAVNLPVVQDTLAVRLTGAYRERDGYVTVVDASGTPVGDSNGADQYLLRGQVGFDAGGITGRIIGDYTKSKAPFGAALEVLQSPVETVGLFPLVGLGPRGGMAAPDVAIDPFDTDSAQAAVDNRIATANYEPVTRSDQWGITGEIEVPLGASADLIYIGSYREFEAFEVYDSDFSGIDVFNVTGNDTAIDTMTHELRLQGETLGDRLQWLIGAYYSKEDISQTVNFSLGEDYGELIGALFAGATGGASLFPPPAGLGLGANPLTVLSGGVDPAGTTNTNLYSQDSKSWSVFTHNTFDVTDALSVTVGLRYSDESKDGAFAQGNNNNQICPAVLGAIGAGLVPPAFVNTVFGTGCFAFTAPADLPAAAIFPLPRTFSSTFDDSELIYTGKVSYALVDPINFYASFTHGYKSGGVNLDSTAAAGGADPRFASEEVDAYEIGMKSRFANGAITLNIAAFHQEFTDFQVLEFTGAQFQTFNVPSAKTTGIEVESFIRPTDNLTVNAALTVMDARYPDDCAGTLTDPNVVSLCGNSLTNAPDIVSILGATYERDLGNNLDWFISAQGRLESDRRTSTQAFDPADLAARILVPFDVQDSNVKINLRAGIGAQDDRWQVEAFVTNLTDEVTRGVTFNTVLRSGSRSAFIQEPRSYGVTVRTRF